MNRFLRSALFPLIVIVLLVYVASQTLFPGRNEQRKMTYSQAINAVKDGNVNEAVFNPNRQSIELTLVLPDGSSEKVKVNYPTPQSATQFENLLQEEGVKFDSKGTGSSAWWALLINVLPFVILIAFWIFLMNQVQGGGSKVMSFGKTRAKRMSPDSPKVTFKDVAGADEAVEELHEIKEFLENPKKFQALGARIPKGVLLYGPPGTGKTLLARAVAGEAGVPFFSISGSDFVEMFVGVGASRVRDLFEQAKQASPCIIFMDEIDAVGRHRGAGLGGGHDEREQTLNQLLVEMDGFEMKDNIILIAATNRPDILDPALLRPGRFDRQIVVDRPDRLGRRKILEVHSRGKPLAREIDLDTLAAGTPGFTGADLSNLINEAALLAARRGKKMIEQDELEEGIMRVIAGPEKKARLLSEKERKITAYHEMGHALVGHYLEHTNPVHKITIVSRGQALGLTISLPTEDRYLTTKSALMDELAMTLGGRAAEELVFHEVTTGAANDLERVTTTSKQMIMRFGMSEKLGPRVLGRNHEMPFLGRDMGSEPDYSDEIAKEIDDEIRRVIEEAHASAITVLRAHMDDLHRLAAILIERETIDKDQFERLLAGESEESVFPAEEEPELRARARRREAAEAQAAAAPDPGHGHAAAAPRGRSLLGLDLRAPCRARSAGGEHDDDEQRRAAAAAPRRSSARPPARTASTSARSDAATTRAPSARSATNASRRRPPRARPSPAPAPRATSSRARPSSTSPAATSGAAMSSWASSMRELRAVERRRGGRAQPAASGAQPSTSAATSASSASDRDPQRRPRHERRPRRRDERKRRERRRAGERSRRRSATRVRAWRGACMSSPPRAPPRARRRRSSARRRSPSRSRRRAEDLALEEPEPVREPLDLARAGLDERDRVDLDDDEVVAARAQVLERGDEARVDERRQREDERLRRQDPRPG